MCRWMVWAWRLALLLPRFAGVQPQPHGRDFARSHEQGRVFFPAQGSLYCCFPGDILGAQAAEQRALRQVRYRQAVVAFT